MEDSVRAEVEKFLGLKVPEKLLADLNGDEVKYLASKDLEDLLLERKPFFLVDKAVGIGKNCVLGIVNIATIQCAGHFPGRPIVPLIRMCEATAQTGVILVGLNTSHDQAPIAIGAGPSKALTRTFIEPPVTLLIAVTKIAEKFGALFIVDGKIFVDEKAVAKLSKIEYFARNVA